jgi:predicted amidohydrolase
MMKIKLIVVVLLCAAGPMVRAAEVEGRDGWRFFAVREEIAPRAQVMNVDGGGYDLRLAGNGERSVDGRWVKRVPVAGGKYYVFNARYWPQGIETPTRSIVASVLWFDEKGKQVEQAEFPLAVPGEDAQGWHRVTGTYRAPDAAREAQLEVRLRWAPEGLVLWRRAELKETAAPEPRKVKVASVNHRPRGTKTSRESLEQFAKFVDEAGAAKADVVCLPEGVTICGTKLKYADVAEPIPGPATEFLGALAAKNRAYVVAGVYEREGKAVYNTSVLLGRDGKLIGKYRKVCLPREEIDGGITPGTEYPVFNTDFGRVGMMICWDVHYPEVARELSARGAEMIFMPIWGGNETLARARAIENQVYVVASGYDFRTAIYDKAGEAVAKSEDRSGVIYAEIDLNQRLLWPWLGDWRSRIWLEGPARVEK